MGIDIFPLTSILTANFIQTYYSNYAMRSELTCRKKKGASMCVFGEREEEVY